MATVRRVMALVMVVIVVVDVSEEQVVLHRRRQDEGVQGLRNVPVVPAHLCSDHVAAQFRERKWIGWKSRDTSSIFVFQ